MRFRIPLAVAVAVIALLLISCGGGGGSSSKPLSATGRAVQNVQRLSIMSMAKGGIALAPFMQTHPGGSNGTTGGTTGSVGGFGGSGFSIGFFFRHFGGPGGFAAKSRGRDEGTNTTGAGTNGGGGGEGDDFYFDPWMDLWAEVAWTETTFSIHFYMDEAKTMPAGHVASTYTGDFTVYPYSYHNEYEFTAGAWAGAHGVYDCVQESADAGHMSYSDTFADGSTDEGESAWNLEHATWESRWDKGDQWFQDSGEWLADGSGTYSNSNSEGWATTWHYNSDWSGSAHFEGPDPLLPADMTWTSDGHYHITYADGSHEEWTWEEFWGGIGEGGTSNTTGVGGMNTSTTGTNTTGLNTSTTGETTTGGNTSTTGL